MNARQKLNQAYFTGSLVMALLAGGVTQSWMIFFAALLLFLAGNWYLDEIRPRR